MEHRAPSPASDRADEHLATAVVQTDARRRLALVELALRAEPRHPVALGLLALSLPSLAEAAPHLEAACRPVKRAHAIEASPEIRAVTDLCRAVRDIAGVDPHSALERTGPLLRAGLTGPVAVALVRTHMAAAAACGDLEALTKGLEAGAGVAESLKAEMPWFAYMAAAMAGRPDAPALGLAARREAGGVVASVSGTVKPKAPGNIGYLGAGDAAVAEAAVLPGLFASSVPAAA